MTFEDLMREYEDMLEDYYYRLKRAEIRKDEEDITETSIKISGVQRFFTRLKFLCDTDEIYQRLDAEKFSYPKEYDGMEIGYVMFYRGFYIPVYIDDYGQQEVAVLENGYTYGAGAYNDFSEFDITDWLDGQIDRSILETGEKSLGK